MRTGSNPDIKVRPVVRTDEAPSAGQTESFFDGATFVSKTEGVRVARNKLRDGLQQALLASQRAEQCRMTRRLGESESANKINGHRRAGSGDPSDESEEE